MDREELIRRQIAARVDAHIMATLRSTLTTAANPAPAPTAESIIAALQRARAKMPKPQTWLSTKHYPSERDALRIDASNEDFLVAHPGLWLRLQDHCRLDASPAGARGNPLFMGVHIVEIDYRSDDTPERRKYLDAIWARLIDAIKVAFTPVPDWLKAAPQFTKHG